jgi:hypothetical protein
MPTPWTHSEEKELLKQIIEKKSYEQIAKIHDRSVSAILLRLNKIVYDNIEAGKSKESMAKLLKLSVEKITQIYYEYKAFIEKKELVKPNSSPKKLSPKKINNKNIILEEKFNILQKENIILKKIIENIQMKHKLKNTINNKDMYKNIIKLIKKLR